MDQRTLLPFSLTYFTVAISSDSPFKLISLGLESGTAYNISVEREMQKAVGFQFVSADLMVHIFDKYFIFFFTSI